VKLIAAVPVLLAVEVALGEVAFAEVALAVVFVILTVTEVDEVGDLENENPIITGLPKLVTWVQFLVV